MKFTIITIIAVVLTLFSCHILQKDRSTLKKLSQTEDLKLNKQHYTLREQSRLILIDSVKNDFTLVLWPKGKFKLSVAKGFEGEAERVMIKGKQGQQRLVTFNHEKKQDSAELKLNYTNAKESTTTSEKNKSKVGFNWGWVVVLPIVYLIYRLYKRFM